MRILRIHPYVYMDVFGVLDVFEFEFDSLPRVRIQNSIHSSIRFCPSLLNLNRIRILFCYSNARLCIRMQDASSLISLFCAGAMSEGMLVFFREPIKTPHPQLSVHLSPLSAPETADPETNELSENRETCLVRVRLCAGSTASRQNQM